MAPTAKPPIAPETDTAPPPAIDAAKGDTQPTSDGAPPVKANHISVAEFLGDTPELSDEEIRRVTVSAAQENHRRGTDPSSKSKVTPVLTALLTDLLDSVTGDLHSELAHAMTSHLKISDADIKEARRYLVESAEPFAKYETPKSLADDIYKHNKPEAFFLAPGVKAEPAADGRYFPNRFIQHPRNYESMWQTYAIGDKVYSLIEDKSYTVLSTEQQSREFQGRTHMPSMNLIEVIDED